VFVLSETDGSGEESHTVAATIFDDCRVADHLLQESIEVQQFLDFALAAQERGELAAIESYRKPPSDPPDLLVTTRGREYAVELTSISTPDVSRQRLSEVRTIGRNLTDLIKRERQHFPHLVGKRIILQELASDDQRPPKAHGRKIEGVVDRLAEALGPGIGTVDRTPLLPPGSPPGTVVPGEVAMRGRAWVDGTTYLLEVHPNEDADSPPNLVANCQVELVSRVLAETLVDRVLRKDREGTEFLLITTGLPDKAGFLCPADSYVFELIKQLASAGRIKFPPLRYLKQVVINHWRCPPWTMVFADGDGLLCRRTA
jgi:hypothetical protein